MWNSALSQVSAEHPRVSLLLKGLNEYEVRGERADAVNLESIST